MRPQLRLQAIYLIVILLGALLLCFTIDRPIYYEEEEILVDEPGQSLAPRRLRLPSPSCPSSLFVMVIHIRVEDADRRNEWRYTYAPHQKIHNFTLIFAVGVPNDLSLLPELESEQAKYGDLLLSDYVDAYKNMTLKHLSQLRFFHENCTGSRFLVKLDDDVAVNVKELTGFISSVYNGQSSWFGMDKAYGPKIWCRVWKKAPVLRSTKTKWPVPRSRWQQRTWPDYCAGMGYIATQPAVARLLRAAEQEAWLWVDDIFVTGILALRGQVQLVEANKFYNLKEDEAFTSFWSRGIIFSLTRRNETWNIFDSIN